MKRTYRGLVLNEGDRVDVHGYGPGIIDKVRSGGSTIDIKLDQGGTIRRHASLCSHRKEEA